MSNKLALILGTLFIVITIIFGTDLIMIQSVYASLDALSESVSFKISSYYINDDGSVSSSVTEFLFDQYQTYLVSNNDDKTNFVEGDVYTYILYKKYTPLFIATEPINISIKRSAVIGVNKL